MIDDNQKQIDDFEEEMKDKFTIELPIVFEKEKFEMKTKDYKAEEDVVKNDDIKTSIYKKKKEVKSHELW